MHYLMHRECETMDFVCFSISVLSLFPADYVYSKFQANIINFATWPNVKYIDL